ncbi:hypothetical protein CC86DRAFT_461225 [Ophiobolus disseminans]|uniref:F-box domain-containing protein n=1 Tax=Ophiobolus disseminans TaxID=1469910 RepID=A0A6A6ZCX4_9PLEO|nr:hypothetical protein CC86DRAFT_461225 [Ophiobolus disseminans]
MHKLKGKAPEAYGLRRSKRNKPSTTSHYSTRPFPFLKLPAELRNSVYEYCLVPSGLKLKFKGGRCTDRDRSGASLTQVCKQIRNEFRPLYLGNIVYIRLSEAERFVQDFLPLSSNMKAHVKLPISIARRRGTNPLDILPLLRSVINRETITVRIECQGPGRRLARTLNRALRRRKQQWQALVWNVSNIYLWPFRDGLTIAFIQNIDDWIEKRDIAEQKVWADLGVESRHRMKLEILHNVGSYGLGRDPEGHWKYLYGATINEPVRRLA